MQKIPTLFKKKYNDNGKYLGVIPEWNVELDPNKLYAATVKWDGTACAIIDGELYKRYDVKPGKKIPDSAIMCQPYDKDAKHNPCWVKCDRNNPSDKWHWAAFDKGKAYDKPVSSKTYPLNDGTYELIGKHIQNNPYHIDDEILIPHGNFIITSLNPLIIDVKQTYTEFAIILGTFAEIEGVVIWSTHNNCLIPTINLDDLTLDKPIAKLRRKDFGYKWNE